MQPDSTHSILDLPNPLTLAPMLPPTYSATALNALHAMPLGAPPASSSHSGFNPKPMKPDDDVKQWLMRYTAFASAQNWSDQRAVRELRKYLLTPDHNLLMMLDSMEPGYTLDRACWKIMQNHGFVAEQSHYGQLLQQRKQQPGESVTRFCAELHEIGRRAYPDMPLGFAPFFRDVFINGLSNDAVRTEVLRQRPNTMQATLDLATRLEELQLTSPRSTTAASVKVAAANLTPTSNARSIRTSSNSSYAPRLQRNNSAPQQQQKPQQRNTSDNNAGSHKHTPAKNANAQPQNAAQPSQPQRPPRQQRQPNATITCHNCGGRGHFQADCPSPRFF